MDATAALTELTGLSTQVVEAVVTSRAAGTRGTVEASRTADEERARTLADTGLRLLETAASIRPSAPDVERVHVDLDRGSVVVVGDADRAIVATTVPEPTHGLVTYDLRTALQRIGGAE